MHSLGNDYVVVNEFKEKKVDDKENFSKRVCRRKFSVGADGVIFVEKSDKYDVKFRIFNADGSEAEMCGNGIRCFAKYVYERVLKKNPLYVETKAGLRVCELEIEDDKVKKIRVYMGKASFKPEDIPLSINKELINEKIEINGRKFIGTAVSVGNPHLIIFVDDLESIRKDLDKIGKELENHPLFPNRINVHFVKVLNRREIRILTWERGVGYTMACGTGATASAYVSHYLNKTDNKVVAHLDGGNLEIEIEEDGIYIKGDAHTVFDGKLLDY